MKVTLSKLPASRVCFDIEIEGEKSQAIYEHTIKQLMQTSDIPGFRKGKAPLQLVLRQLGEQSLKDNILEGLIKKALFEVIQRQSEENNDLEFLGEFEVSPPFEELSAAFEYGKPLVFQATIDVNPEATLKQYKGFQLQVEKVEPKFDDIDKRLQEFQERNATLVPVEGRGAQTTDVVTATMYVLDELGEEIFESRNDEMQLDLGDPEYPPALIEGILGMNVGEEKHISLDLPEDFFIKALAGKSTTFVVAIHDIKEKELPPLDDEFARRISDKETMAELRQFLEECAIEEAEEATQVNLENAILDAITAEMELELPASLIHTEVENIVNQQLIALKQMAGGNDKMLKRLLTQDFMNYLYQSNESEAIKRLQHNFALAAIAKLEDMTVDPEELDAKIYEYMEALQDSNYDFIRLHEVAEDELLAEQVLEWLKANVEVTYVPEGSLAIADPKEDGNAMAEEDPAETSDGES